MKRRKRVWVVLGPQGGLVGVFFLKMDALDDAERYGCFGYPHRVVPAIVEYEIPAKKEGK